jgi:hypothetical protein
VTYVTLQGVSPPPHMPDGSANKPLTNDQETGFHVRNLGSELLFLVGVAGFEPTASSSRTRVGRDDQYQRVLWRARGLPRRVIW